MVANEFVKLPFKRVPFRALRLFQIVPPTSSTASPKWLAARGLRASA
jgi:hypothetical protein